MPDDLPVPHVPARDDAANRAPPMGLPAGDHPASPVPAAAIPASGVPATDVPAPRRSLPSLFLRGLARGLARAQGVRHGGTGPLPVLQASREDVPLDPARIARWADVCRWPLRPGEVPLPYPEILFLDLLGSLALDRRYPISPLGMIHVRQSLRSLRPLRPGTAVRLEARTADLRQVARGLELDLALAVDDGAGRAWEGVATFLSRAPEARRGHRTRDREADRGPDAAEALPLPVPADTGRAFARVTGDWNPHHLWPWSSRLLGYPRPIAHGMWTLSAALGLLGFPSDPAAPVEAACRFLRPLAMPGRAVVRALPAAPDGTRPLEVRDAATEVPHLAATIREGA